MVHFFPDKNLVYDGVSAIYYVYKTGGRKKGFWLSIINAIWIINIVMHQNKSDEIELFKYVNGLKIKQLSKIKCDATAYKGPEVGKKNFELDTYSHSMYNKESFHQVW